MIFLKTWRFPVLLLCLLAFAFGACTKANPVPPSESGVDVLGADTNLAFIGNSSEAVKIEAIAVSGQVFSTAWRVTGLLPLAQPYFSQLSAGNVVPIASGDVMLVQFWARSVSGAARTEFVFELNADPYDKSVSAGVPLTSDWTLYSVPFKAGRAFAVGQGVAHFRLGYVNQSFELAGVVLKNFAQSKKLEDLDFLGFSYVGREANAAWRVAAETRIDQVRKADLKVKVLDAGGNAVPNASVKLEMTRHAFAFGSAVAAEQLLGSSADSQKYKQVVLELFNRAVLENDLKWSDWESYSRNQALAAIDYLTNNNISVRGHNLIWACQESYCLPSDVPNLFSNPTALRSRIDSHLVDVLGATKGKLVEWDVVNEPSANKRLTNVLGEAENVAWYKRVKELDAVPKLFVNDYGNLGEGNLDVEYKRIIKKMLDNGAPLEGIGLQAHFALQLTSPEDLNNRFNDFGQFGLSLAITEFDVNINNEALQADYTRDFLTIAFANPNVSSFLMWGFWAGRHWLPLAAMYRQDWSLKPNGVVFKDLVFNQWWTNTTLQSNATGQVATRGFMGDYKLTATVGGQSVSKLIKLEKNSAEFVLQLP
jgi:endo-1,4-beta-xylanase